MKGKLVNTCFSHTAPYSKFAFPIIANWVKSLFALASQCKANMIFDSSKLVVLFLFFDKE